MAKLYAKKIRAGKMTLDQVPEIWRQAVLEELMRK